mmetsp:Transcript_38543/g.151993  ORF Transcript_38543/g.151993 Transcript_38543/m.151993 type:complete len:177 (+) Transcript_38543:1074-1604(+)
MWTSCEKQIIVGDIDVLTSPEVECGANSVIRRSGAADTVTKRSILDCVLTPYHLLLLTRIEIIAVKRLTLSVEFEKDFSPFLSRAGHRIDELVAFTRDALSGSLWVVTKHGGVSAVEHNPLSSIACCFHLLNTYSIESTAPLAQITAYSTYSRCPTNPFSSVSSCLWSKYRKTMPT